MDISRARNHLPLFSAILFSMCPLNFFRAIRAALQLPVGLKYLKQVSYPLPEVSTGLTRVTKQVRPLFIVENDKLYSQHEYHVVSHRISKSCNIGR